MSTKTDLSTRIKRAGNEVVRIDVTAMTESERSSSETLGRIGQPTLRAHLQHNGTRLTIFETNEGYTDKFYSKDCPKLCTSDGATISTILIQKSSAPNANMPKKAGVWIQW